MYPVKDVKTYLEQNLSRKRYQHSLNVAKAAKQLAQRYGADPEKAYYAGLVHDICKETDIDVQQAFVRKYAGAFPPDLAELNSRKTWHGIAGAYFIEAEFGVTDEEILNAVRFHTVGRPGMSLLEEIIYIADTISEERDYKDVAKYRKAAFEDLQETILAVLRYSIATVMKKQGMLTVYTVNAYNDYYLKQEARKDTK